MHYVLRKPLHKCGGAGEFGVTKRGGTFHLRRRVPARCKSVELRETVWISLHTDSDSAARSKADRAWSQKIEPWEARLSKANTAAHLHQEYQHPVSNGRRRHAS
ncbi:DUF6538 domain-containing protein [Tropicimonas sp. IMCC34043]|uniref:DUF6538 domain-containing protein n=1 Tax=Tropicimonas sp. IMCC34043 TaxID=2248760 RepID=UPI0035155FE4